ncbi:MAG TPA: LysR family transcriptional regulator [Chloroflexota bacterium]|nr:LysR family transcriptional regulator [Chloroflexota bacterium]HZU07575.1 LysR family transcriptional regulator [Chloroflexota bacterium]
MRLADLATFRAVMRQGTATKAAVALGLSQATVSERLAALERELGGALFRRTGRRLEPTAMGAALLPFAERLLSLEEEARSQARQALGRGARLALAATPTTSTYLLPPLLRQLHEQHPRAEMAVRVAQPPEVARLVLDHLAAVALNTAALVVPELEQEYLCADPIVPVAAPTLRARLPQPLPVAALGDVPLISTEANTGYWHRVEDYLARHGVRPRVAMDLDYIEVVKQMVWAGLGVSFVPRSAVADDLQRGTLAELAITPAPALSRPIYLVWRRRRPPEGLAAAFAAVARAALADPPPADAAPRPGAPPPP